MIFFISDIHLGIQEREADKLREDLLLKFFRTIRPVCSQLFIVGDLFDYWFEYRTVIPRYFYRTLTELGEMTRDGIEIKYIIGNHDFGHYRNQIKRNYQAKHEPKAFFEEELGIELFFNDLEVNLGGKNFFISHGDGKANNDTGYLILKSILRNHYCLKFYRMIHPDCAIALASNSSRKSRKYTDKKEYGLAEGMEDFAEKKINEGFDYVVMGHRHSPCFKKIGDGIYVNIGDWVKNQPKCVRFDGNELELVNIDDVVL